MKNSRIERMDKELSRRLRDAMKERYKKGLAKMSQRELSMPEATRLLLRTPSWPNVEQELRCLPKKRRMI